jgi:hypothetical protein
VEDLPRHRRGLAFDHFLRPRGSRPLTAGSTFFRFKAGSGGAGPPLFLAAATSLSAPAGAPDSKTTGSGAAAGCFEESGTSTIGPALPPVAAAAAT